jgi:flagellar motor switch protein FliN
MVNQATALLIETGKALNWGGSATVAPRIDLRSGERQDRLDERHEPDDDKQLNLEIQFGHTRLAADEASTLRNGSVVVLDEAVGEPVDIVADSRPIGRGEIVVIDGKIGVRIVELAGARGCTDRQDATPFGGRGHDGRESAASRRAGGC